MKILLVSPVQDQNEFAYRGILIPQLALYILQGLTPEQHEVKIIEEEYTRLDLNEECDVVGISCMTSNVNRGYRIADSFRQKDTKVIMGGIHPSLLPDEALEHSDAVVIGEAEGVWAQILEDIESNKLQRIYHEPNPDLETYVPKDFSSLPEKRLFDLTPLQTTRGCPHNCDFCCVSDVYGRKIKNIPVKNVVRDIRESGTRNYIFLDDNIIGNPEYARELFRALIPLKINWVGQSSISFAQDTEILELAGESGCKGLFIGLESVVETNKQKYNKLRSLEDTRQGIRRLLRMGIIIQASVIFGFDEDTPETFRQTVRFLIRNRISLAAIHVLTPYPGTRIHKELKEGGRLLHEKWDYYDHHTVVFKPQKMTPLELQMGTIRAKSAFNSFPSIARRLSGNMRMPGIYLAGNMGYRKHALAERMRLREFKSQNFER